MQNSITSCINRAPWNRGKMMGQKPPLKWNEIWAIRTRLEISG
jgi:hypothetical protein